MKTSLILAALLLSGRASLFSQPNNGTQPAPPQDLPAPTPYRVVNNDANSRVWQRETYERSPDGRTVTRIHRYEELSSGLYYKDLSGNWQESKDLIEPYSQGSIARQGPYQVIFANNLNSAGSIDMQTPDGQRLRSNILGLMYHDTSSGESVLIAQVQDSTGQLLTANQVLYINAFNGLKADIRYDYNKGRFSQDVILREQLPSPESYSMNPATTEVEVMTEFLNPPQETIKEHAGANGTSDQEISWGATHIGHGNAFDLGDQKDFRTRVSVTKEYLTVEGRKILLEKVPLEKIQPRLQSLPLHSSRKSHLPKTASKQLRLPKPLLAQTAGQPMKLALSSPANQGYVLDYVIINTDQTDFTFQADTTYYISDYCYLPGTAIFEGGTVLKFDRYGQLGIYDSQILCKTAPYCPALFTSINDDTVGETIDGSSGTPTFDDNWFMFDIWTTNTLDFRGLRFSYGYCPLYDEEAGGQWNFWDCQFNMDSCAMLAYNLSLHNVLIGTSTNSPDSFPELFLEGPILEGEHVTADQGLGLVELDNTTNNFVSLTNCLITGQAIIYSGINYTLTTNCTAWLPSVTGPVYQVVGAASYYLTNGSPYRDAGTTNIDPAVLADIATKTTYPPMVYSNTAFPGGTYSPQAQRDTGTPALGYHYDPVDYCFGLANATTNVTFTAGTAVAYFDLPDSPYYYSYGLGMPEATFLTYNGTVTAPCVQARYNTVQEGNGNWTAVSPQSVVGVVGFVGALGDAVYVPADDPTIDARFTLFAGLANTPGIGQPVTSGVNWRFTDCVINSGRADSYDVHFCLTNCLLFGTYSGVFSYDTASASMSLQNCTFGGGVMYTARFGGSTWPIRIQNCAFDSVDLSDLVGKSDLLDTNITYYDYNAFVTNEDRLPQVGAHDVIVTNFNWQTSWLGSFYLPTNSPLINAGYDTADQWALYHFTTQTNQVKETNSIVDIGYHFVATDAYGNPVDSNGDGIPDYLEDANGDGIFDGDELVDWQLPVYRNGVMKFPNGFGINIFESKPRSYIP